MRNLYKTLAVKLLYPTGSSCRERIYNLKYTDKMKKTLFAMLLTLACLTGAQAQRFEWAKGYASS